MISVGFIPVGVGDTGFRTEKHGWLASRGRLFNRPVRSRKRSSGQCMHLSAENTVVLSVVVLQYDYMYLSNESHDLFTWP
jgi:hypothetical protein